MTKLTEILRSYGKKTVEEVNAELEANGFGEFKLDPDKCNFTDEQIKDGWGLLDTGTGSFDPARMVNGELVTYDGGCSEAIFYHDGKKYNVIGKKLEEVFE